MLHVHVQKMKFPRGNHYVVPIGAKTCANSIKAAKHRFRHIKIQPKTIDLSTRLMGITTEFVGFIPKSLVLKSIVLG